MNIDHDFDNICFPKKLRKKIGIKFRSWSSRKVHNFLFDGFNEWEIGVYFGPLFVLVKTLLDALTNSALMDRNLLLARSPASSQFATQPSFEVTMEKYFHSNWANSPYYSGIPLLPETKVVWVLWTGSSKTIISRSFKRNSIQCPKNTSVSIERLSELYFCSGWWERRMQALELGRRQNHNMLQ